jgi:CDP-diacylglycerol--glycerol-3-phosphate 3-phosphatidyltransferase
VNLPNSITMSRIFSVPLLIWILSSSFPLRGSHGEQEILASAVFILASITDGVDGYLARRRGQITTMGMLLDPLADKLMISAAYIVLVAYNPRIVPPWIAVLVIGREFLVSGLMPVHLIAVMALYWMAFVSILSAVDYFIGFWKKIDHASASRRRRRSSFVLSRRKKAVPPSAPSENTPTA